MVPGRTGKQCRERWINHLSPSVVKEPWSKEEDATVLRLIAIYGHRWAKISRHLPGRTDAAVGNRFHQYLKLHHDIPDGHPTDSSSTSSSSRVTRTAAKNQSIASMVDDTSSSKDRSGDSVVDDTSVSMSSSFHNPRCSASSQGRDSRAPSPFSQCRNTTSPNLSSQVRRTSPTRPGQESRSPSLLSMTRSSPVPQVVRGFRRTGPVASWTQRSFHSTGWRNSDDYDACHNSVQSQSHDRRVALPGILSLIESQNRSSVSLSQIPDFDPVLLNFLIRRPADRMW